MADIRFFNPAFQWALVFIGLVWIKRVFWMRSFKISNPPLIPITQKISQSPKVSIIVPARNEEKNIGNCLKYLTAQNYPNYEIICVDDRSNDKTGTIIESFQKNSSVPIKIVRIEKLPQGWTGKNYAMFTGSKAASGEWILFTDADTTHKPKSLSTALFHVLGQKIDFLTLAPETESKTFWENVVQPLAVSSLALWFQTHKVNNPKNPITLANGQFILVKRSVYDATGGNESVKNEVIEDVEFAKRIKAFGFNVKFLNGTLLYSTRMYSTLKEIKTGWTRIFTYLFNKKVFPIIKKIFLFIFFSILPFFILLTETILKFTSTGYFSRTIFTLSFGVCLLIVTIRFFGNKLMKSNPWYAVFHPLGSLIMVWILFSCVGRIIFQRPSTWRGDLYR